MFIGVPFVLQNCGKEQNCITEERHKVIVVCASGSQHGGGGISCFHYICYHAESRPLILQSFSLSMRYTIHARTHSSSTYKSKTSASKQGCQEILLRNKILTDQIKLVCNVFSLPIVKKLLAHNCHFKWTHICNPNIHLHNFEF